MSPHHALPSANVIENPPYQFQSSPPPAPVAEAHVPGTLEGAASFVPKLPLIPPFRIPWKVCCSMLCTRR
jgi:hypothetical protein